MPPEQEVSFTLNDGRTLLIAAKRVCLWFSVLVELEDDNLHKHLRLPINQLARLNALDDDDLEWQDPAELMAIAQAVVAAPLPEKLQMPETLLANLRPYQKLGVAWMQQRANLAVGGILADDMGLGKTLQTLSHISVSYTHLTLPTIYSV